VAGRDKPFHRVINPILREILFFAHDLCQLADDLGGLKHGVHIFGRNPGVKGQHHHLSSKQANLSGQFTLSELIRQ